MWRAWSGPSAVSICRAPSSSLFSLGTALVYPQVIRLIIDEAIEGGQAQRLNQLSLWMVVILLVEAVATGARDYYFGLGAERVGVRLRRLVFDTLLRQDIEFFDTRDIGEITTRLWADVPPLEYVLGEEFADSLRFAVFGVCGTGLLFYTSPQLTLLILLAVPPIVFATSVLGRRVKVLAADVQTAHAEAGAAATEVLAGIRTVRAFSQEPAERVAVRSPDDARPRVRAPEGAGAGAARRRVADCRRVRGAARHLGGRSPHRGRPHDDRRPHLVHPVRAARGPRVPEHLAVHRRSAAGHRRHAVGVRAARPDPAHSARRRRASCRPGRFDRARAGALSLPDAAGGGGAQGRRPAHRGRRGGGAGRQVGIRQVDASSICCCASTTRPRGASSSAGGTCAS